MSTSFLAVDFQGAQDPLDGRLRIGGRREPRGLILIAAMSSFRRKLDIPIGALEALLNRAFGSRAQVHYSRAPEGVSTQVYRLARGEEVFYLRIAEDEIDNLAVEAELFRQLANRGVKVPRVVCVSEFDADIQRSVLIMTEVPGSSLAHIGRQEEARPIVRAAGRDLALLNQVPVRGFGWIRREEAIWPLLGECETYEGFVVSCLAEPWPGPLAQLFSAQQLRLAESMIETERSRELRTAFLAHGDFDVTPIFQSQGEYTGLIDFGEIRGTEPTFDLGHFYLHDCETLAVSLFDSLLEGYEEVVGPGRSEMALIRRSAFLLGLRQLCRWVSPQGRSAPPDHPLVVARVRRLAQLLRESNPDKEDASLLGWAGGE